MGSDEPPGVFRITKDKVTLRAASRLDDAFALKVTESCMKKFAEQTWGVWNGEADFDAASDKIIKFGMNEIGILGVERNSGHWILDKLYILLAFQNRGIGSCLIEKLKDDARGAQVAIRLSVLEVNPAYRFYEKHGFVLTKSIPPRRHMEWRDSE